MVEQKKGKVFIVGAGPGDEGLLTIKAKEIMQVADIILYDILSNKDLLSYCKDNAEKIFVGKQAGMHTYPQEEINQMLIEYSMQGKIVVRLKGGDPLIFGRGSEEALQLVNSEVDFEIIPGVTAGSGASTYAGIPLTHRDLVTQCVFVTAHESPDKENSQVPWDLLAKMPNTTLVIYMGAKNIGQIADILINNGMLANTPVAIIRNGTLPQQKTYITVVSEMQNKASEHNIQSPVIILIGPTVGLREYINWFEKKKLFGKRIAITRAVEQSSKLRKMLSDEGAIVLQLSTIKTELTEPAKKLSELLENKFDWIIFSSENGVRYFFRQLFREGLDGRALAGSRIAVIGQATADKLKSYSIMADYIPEKYTSENLIYGLKTIVDLSGKKILRVKGDFEKDFIYESLIENGAKLEICEVYKTLQGNPESDVIKDISNNGADAVIFTSSSTVINFFNMIGKEAIKILNSSKVISIGPITTKTLEKYSVQKIYTAKVQTVEGIIDLLLSAI